MKILYATSEAVPFCKTGGLADVAGSLPPALAEQGAEIAVVLPLYRRVADKFGADLKFVCYDFVDLGWRHIYCGLFTAEKDGVTWYFIDNEQYFDRADLYGYDDDGERFGFFSRAVVKMLDHMKFWPDVIHCNDWQTALIPIYLADDGVREDRYRSIRTALTIHNIEYQGRYNSMRLGDLFGLDAGWAHDGTIMMDGDVNLLKGAILTADAINAVSPSYANELKMPFFAHRLDGIMNQCSYKLSGVLNGIDMVRYNPETDEAITANYSMANMAGKAENKAALQRMMGLHEDPNVPIVAIVSRLVSHKGLDLICEVLRDMMEQPLQLVILGKGDQKYEEFFAWAQSQYPGRMAVRLDYNEALSMAIYSGADLFLMPSKSEPCGLSQMIAMRYGTVPIVRETGGLRDSVQPYEAWRDAGTGFTFANYASADMLYVIRAAVELYHNDPAAFARLRERAMSGDFSWKRSAKDYMRIYASITGGVFADAEVPAEAVVEEAPAVEAVVEEAPVVEKPKRTRKTAAKKEAVEGEEKPKRTRKSTKKVTEETAEAPAAEAVAEEKPKRTRKSTKKVAEETAESPAAEAVGEEKPKRTRKSTKKVTEETAEAPAAEAVAEEKPKRTRKTTKKAAAEDAAEE